MCWAWLGNDACRMFVMTRNVADLAQFGAAIGNFLT